MFFKREREREREKRERERERERESGCVCVWTNKRGGGGGEREYTWCETLYIICVQGLLKKTLICEFFLNKIHPFSIQL